MRGYTKIVEILVKAGAKVDVKNKEGKTAADVVRNFQRMSEADKEEILKLLRPSVT